MSPKKKTKAKPLTIVTLSGSTGTTSEEVIQAALAQFKDPNVQIVAKTKVRTIRAAERAVKYAAEHDAVLCHTIVAPKVREAVVRESRRLDVPTVDLLGPILSLLEDHLHQTPRLRPGLSYRLRKEQFDRRVAVDFTLSHDDGCGLADIDKADVVLVGVSRSSKSVTCFYLAYWGIRAANVPLIPGCDPPAELLALPKKKVIGLTVNANRLRSLRRTRLEMMGDVELDKYVDPTELNRELNAAIALMSKYRWRRIDVSYMSVEEIAKEVATMIGR